MAAGVVAMVMTVWASFGCAAGANGRRTKYFFAPSPMTNGFEHPWFHYSIARDPSAPPGDFFPNWRVENFIEGDDGLFRPRSTDEYVQRFDIDVDDDEDVDIRGLRSLYDFRLVHRSTGALMWIESIPVAGNDASLEPRFALTEYVGRLGGTLTSFTDYGTRSRTFVAQMESTGPVTVDGLVGAAATVSFRADHRVAGDTQAPEPLYIARYVMVTAPFTYSFRVPVPNGPNGGERAGAPRRRLVTLPARVVFGYFHHASDFTTHVADFERFVDAFACPEAHGETTGIRPPAPAPEPPVSVVPGPT